MTIPKCFSILFVLILGFTMSACSTVSGVGKDLQKAGQVIEEEADRKQNKK